MAAEAKRRLEFASVDCRESSPAAIPIARWLVAN
jgi:hypothetical protein